jgi:hypothetical protein
VTGGLEWVRVDSRGNRVKSERWVWVPPVCRRVRASGPGGLRFDIGQSPLLPEDGSDSVGIEMDIEEIAQGCLEQARWAARLGSPMYEGLLLRMADDIRASGPCLAALEPHVERSRMLAPLLLLAAIHRTVLEGQFREAARFYPSAGGQLDVDALWPHFLDAVPRAVLPPCVQTNEIERSLALLPGFQEVGRRTGLPLRLLEIGASAGLNLRWDHFPFLSVPTTMHVIERRGCDLNPIDPTLTKTAPPYSPSSGPTRRSASN